MEPEWVQAPAVIRVSDAVEPGDVFNVYGEGFDKNTEIYLERVNNVSPDELPGEKAVKCEILNIDAQGQTVSCIMNEELKCGTYNLWATNSSGTGVPVGFNTSRPQWMSVDSVAPGMTFKVIGKNMSSAAYSNGNKAYAAFVGESGTYDVKPIAVNEFCVELECPEIPSGEYDIYISNDGRVWNKPEDGLKLTVTGQVNDPYEIGVAWADNFNYSKTYNVLSYGAKPNDNKDDTSAFKIALGLAKYAGGGILYIPEGTYDITELDISAGIVLAGDGMDKTILNCLGTSKTSHGYPVLDMRDGYNGIYGLTLHEDTGIDSPDEYIIIYGHSFLKDFKLDVPMVPENVITDASIATGEGRGIGVIIGGEGYNVVDNCKFVGYNAQITHSEPRKYIYIGNNEFDTTIGVLSAISSYIVFENNDIERYVEKLPDYLDAYNTQGIFTRGPSYISGNTIKNLGCQAQNDGEIICAESYKNSIKLAGMITEADADTVTVSTYSDVEAYNNGTLSWSWELDNAAFNENYLVITQGRGMGQYRKIKSFDESTKTIELTEEFDVLPNSESHFTIQELSDNVTIYKNYAENSKKGFWLYQDCVDGVISQNTGINTQGAFIRSIYREDASMFQTSVAYFNRIDKNYFRGQSARNRYTNVAASVQACIEGENPDFVLDYGTEITENTIIGDGVDATAGTGPQCWLEPPIHNGISIECSNNYSKVDFDVVRGTIINKNELQNVTDGIVIDDCNTDYNNIGTIIQKDNIRK